MIAVFLWFWAMIAIAQAFGWWVLFAALLVFLLGWNAGRLTYILWGLIALSMLSVSTFWMVVFACLALLSIYFE